MAYAILRFAKLSHKTGKCSLKGSAMHNFREHKTANADPARTPNNRTSGAQSADAVVAALDARLATQAKVRKNGVLAVEYFVGMSPEFVAEGGNVEGYFDKAEQWLKAKHGAENVLAVTRQYDETTPHMCAYVVPIDKRGKLNASAFFDGSKALSDMQTDFAETCGKPYGLERGIERSGATHQTIREYYAKIQTPTPAITTKVPKVEEPTLSEKIAESVGLSTKHAEQKAKQEAAIAKRNSEIKAMRDAEAAKAKQFAMERANAKARDGALERLREQAVQLRQIPLQDILERFGATIDPKDKNNWRAITGRITVTDTKFYNHDTGKGGGGAIDLVMHLDQCDYKTAIAALAREFGSSATLSEVTVTQKQEIEAAAAAPPPAFTMPAAAAGNWPRVRKYLTEVRRLSGALVDALKSAGKVYADSHANAVFVQRKEAGVELRGTGDGKWSGFRGKKTGFLITCGSSGVKNVAFVESAIDALSLYESGKFEGRIIAIGGDNAAYLQKLAENYRQKGYSLYAAFDNDAGGDRQSALLVDAIRLRPSLKDWNDDLVESKRPQPAQAKPTDDDGDGDDGDHDGDDGDHDGDDGHDDYETDS